MNADDLLRRALDCWDFNDDPYFDDVNAIMQEIRAYLDAPKDEPVAWQGLKMHEVVSLWSEALDPAYFARAIEQALKEKNSPPTKTAPREPMTDFREYFEEMRTQLQEDYGDNVHIFEAGFNQGARWVQMDHSPFRHHGITGEE